MGEFNRLASAPPPADLICQWLTLKTTQLGCGSMWMERVEALGTVGQRVASTRGPLHIIPISANGPVQHSQS